MKSRWLILATLGIAGFAVYANSIGNDFVWDDHSLVVNNSLIQEETPLIRAFQTDIFQLGRNQGSFYRPIQILSYRWDLFWWKLASSGYHLTNILLHCLNGWLVYLLCLSLTQGPLAAWLAATWFLIHPVHTEAVAYISGRADLLASLFLLLTLRSHRAAYGRNGDKGRLGLVAVSLGCFSLALLSKEIALVGLAFLPMADILLNSGTNRKPLFASIGRYAPFVILAILYLVGRAAAVGTSPGLKIAATLPVLTRLQAGGQAFWMYLQWILVPYPLHMEHHFSPELLRQGQLSGSLGVLLFAGMVLTVVRSYRRLPVFAFGMGWFLIALLPSLNFVVPVNAFAAEHWLYLPFVGIAVLAAWGWNLLERRAKLRSCAAVVIAGLFAGHGILTVRQNRVWRDSVTLFEHTVRWAPASARAHYLLAGTYQQAGRLTEAVRENRAVLQCDTDFPGIHNDLGVLLGRLHQHEEAVRELQEELRLSPEDGKVWNNLGNVYQGMGQAGKAMEAYRRALQLNPELHQTQENLHRVQQQAARVQ